MLGNAQVSGFVCTYNEQDSIRDCLESMKWVDEIVVVDSFSTDDTAKIASDYTDRVIKRPFEGYVDQFSFACAQTTGEWVLWLDADERLTPDALAEVRILFERPDGPVCDAFAFPRKTRFMGRWIAHSGWYPQHKVRLFRRACTRIGGTEPHAEAIVDGTVTKLRGEILHDSYPGGLVDMLQRSARFAGMTAAARFRRGKRFSLLRLLLEPPLVFLQRYLLKLGMLDGIPGLAICASAGYYRFMRQLKLWEIAHAPTAGDADG